MFLRFSGCDSLRLASGLTRRSVKIRLEPHHCEVGLPWRFMRRARATRRNSSGAPRARKSQKARLPLTKRI